MKPICPPGKPCHVYATIPENATDNVFISVHTHKDVKELSLIYFDE